MTSTIEPMSLQELESKILDHHARTGEWPTRRELKVEKTLRSLKIAFPDLIAKLGGPAVKVTTKQQGLNPQQLKLLEYLPDIEREMVTAYFKGTKQQEIATRFGMTQPGVSYRLGRALKRIHFLEQYPVLTEAEIKERLVQADFAEDESRMLAIICTTTCQSSAAKELDWSQGKVRHHHWKAIEKLRTASQPELQPILLSLEMVRDNPAILHEYPSVLTRRSQ